MDSPNLFYSAYVIEALKQSEIDHAKQGFSGDAEALREWQDLIRRSVKFALPPQGSFISANQGLPIGLAAARLPYPLISLEVPYPDSATNAGGGAASTQRHILLQEAALLNEPGQAPTAIRHAPDPTGFLVTICSFFDGARRWVPQAVAGFIPYGTPVVERHKAHAEAIAPAPGIDAYQFSPVPVLPDTVRFIAQQLTPTAFQQMIMDDTVAEIRIAYEFLSVVSAANCAIQEHVPTVEMNKARTRKAKEPFHRYSTLEIRRA